MKKILSTIGTVSLLAALFTMASGRVHGQTPDQLTPARSHAATGPRSGVTGTSPVDWQQAATPATGRAIASPQAERDLLNRYCAACHSERAAAAGMDSARKLALDTLSLDDVQEHAESWELVVRKLRAGMMPPAGLRRPDAATYEGMIVWLESKLDRTAEPMFPPPGLHRMNRTEYANAIRDLFDLQIDSARYLPSDDSTSGFDNIAGALGISSTLVEAYVTAAQKLSRLIVGEAEPPTLVVYRTPEDTDQDYHVPGLPFGTRGGMLVEHVFPSDGEYEVTVTPIFGDNMSPAGFGSVPCEKLEILLDSEQLALMDWRGGGRMPRAQCDGEEQDATRSGQSGPEAFFGGRGGEPMRVRFTTTAGLHRLGATYPQTNLAPLLDMDRQFLRSTVQTGPTPGYTFFPHVGTLRIEGPFDAVPAQDSASRRRVFSCHPSEGSDEEACAREIIERVATRAFRRPASESDVELLMAFYREGRTLEDFDQGIEFALARVLASPQFIYRIEEEPASQAAYPISDLDLASRLSFFLWSSIPDDELIDVASQGRLREPEILEAQVRRMLMDPKAESLAVNFAGQWLNLRGLDSAGPLPMIYPDFDNPLRQSMRREVELLFDDIVRQDRSIMDLLTADYTFVDERLARHYGIPHVYGSRFRRVELGPELDARKGLLGKGAFLVTSSKPDRTSPVSRGKWIMTNILGMSPPDPPANVPPLPPRQADAAGNTRQPTMREKMLDHRVRPDCVQCHRLMDPIGFTLENFDAVGTWRTDDGGAPVDSSGQMFDNSEVDGPAGLRDWVVNAYGDQFVAVAVEKLMTYALGRGIEYFDMPVVRRIARTSVADGARFSSLVLGVVNSQPFQMNMKIGEPAGGPRAAQDASGQQDAGNRELN